MSNGSAPRTIVIGDVHGCADELQDLLRAAGAGPQDRLISVGDLIGKGPDSRAVLDWAMKAPNLECALGNHELRFLRHWKLGPAPDEKPADRETRAQLLPRVDEYLRFIESWPLYIARRHYLVVHAGFDPRKSLRGHDADELTNIRRLDDDETPWYEAYEGRRLVVFGHWARHEPVIRENVIGLDTGCVYGGALSALILPERRVISVRARRAYCRKASWSRRVLAGTPEEIAWTR